MNYLSDLLSVLKLAGTAFMTVHTDRENAAAKLEAAVAAMKKPPPVDPPDTKGKP